VDFDEFKCAVKNNNYPFFGDFSTFLDDLSLVINDSRDKEFFRNFRLPNSHDMALIQSSYDSLVPFIVESASGQHDIYCYDFEQEAYPEVAVFSDHAIVKRWKSTPDFISWFSRVANEHR
jgi:hypothetical protein